MTLNELYKWIELHVEIEEALRALKNVVAKRMKITKIGEMHVGRIKMIGEIGVEKDVQVVIHCNGTEEPKAPTHH